jgi:glycosyltransferase involved in cell wall biosynthesis
VEHIKFRRLIAGPPPASDRIFFHHTWFKGHNNPRYARLLPRLERLDRFVVTVSDRRPLRGIEARALRATRQLRHRIMFRAANRRYRWMFAIGTEQIPHFRGTVVVDCDEPRLTKQEVELLNRPNVAAVVVVTDGVARRYEELGLRTPCHVIPQGVDLGLLSRSDIAAVAERHRRDGHLVVGYISAWFLTPADRRHDEIYDIEHLLELWDAISVRLQGAQLWLIGRASKRARALCAARDDVTLFEDIPYGGALPYIANFDIALYPRRTDPPRPDMAVKLVEYMGAGVPVVSYDLESTAVVRQTGAGIPASTPRDFVEAVEHLALDEPERRRLAGTASTAAAAFDWDDLVRRYQDEVLDCYLA